MYKDFHRQKQGLGYLFKIITSLLHSGKPSQAKPVSDRLVGQVIHARISTKGMIKLEQPVKSTHPRIILLAANDAWHAPMPLLARSRAPNKLAFHANLAAGEDAAASLPVNAQVELATTVSRAHTQDHFGVERQHERTEAQTARADGRDEQGLDEGVDNGSAGTEAVGCRPRGCANEDTIGRRFGQEVAVLVNVNDGKLRVGAAMDRNLVDGAQRGRGLLGLGNGRLALARQGVRHLVVDAVARAIVYIRLDAVS